MNVINKYLSQLWRFVKNGFMQMLSANVLNKIVAMLSNMVITRVLTVADYGSWSYILNVYTYFSLVAGFGLTSGAFQFGAENRGGEKEFQYYAYCLKRGLLLNVGLVVFGIGFAYFVKLPLENIKLLLISYFPMLLLEYIMNLFVIILRCQNRIKEYARVLNTNTVLIALGTCAGSFWGISGVIAGKYIAYIASVALLMRLMKDETLRLFSQNMLEGNEIRKLWNFSIISCISSAMNSLLYLLDVSMITALLGSAEDTAIYKVATLAPNALAFIPSSIIVCILPNIVHNNKNRGWLKSHVRTYYLGMGAANLAIAGTAIAMAPLIIRILSGEQYLPAVPYFRILLIGYFISSTFRSLSGNILFALKKVKINMITSVISGCLDIVLNYYFITGFGVAGAAVATVTAETIASAIAFSYTYYYIYLRKGELSGD